MHDPNMLELEPKHAPKHYSVEQVAAKCGGTHESVERSLERLASTGCVVLIDEMGCPGSSFAGCLYMATCSAGPADANYVKESVAMSDADALGLDYDDLLIEDDVIDESGADSGGGASAAAAAM